MIEKGETCKRWDTWLTKLKKVRHMSHQAETHVSPSWKKWSTPATWKGHNHYFEASKPVCIHGCYDFHNVYYNHHNRCTMQDCLVFKTEKLFRNVPAPPPWPPLQQWGKFINTSSSSSWYYPLLIEAPSYIKCCTMVSFLWSRHQT